MIQPGDFAAVQALGFDRPLIRLGQWLNGEGFRDYEHALFFAGYYHATPDTLRPVVGSGSGYYVAEADPGGARLRRIDFRPEDYPGAFWSSGIIDLDPYRTDILHWMRRKLGTPYSALDYFALAAHRMKLHPIDNALKHRIASDQHMICSQYVDWVLGASGLQLFADGRWDGYVTPLSIAKRLSDLRGY